MRGTYFMESSYVIASIMRSKRLHYIEEFVTFKEFNLVRDELQKEFNKKNISVCITNEIDRDYFNITGDVYVLANGVTLKKVENRYQGYCPSIEALNILWDDKKITKYVQRIKTISDKHLSFETKTLEEILDKIVEKPRKFYEQIAQELSSEEYEFVKSQLVSRNCDNCSNDCSNKSMNPCDEWKNDELVGRSKVLTKNI